MTRRTCIFIGGIHLFALAVCTYIAAWKIESILGTGWLCSLTGIAVGVAGIVRRRPLLAVAGFLTPVLAVVMTVLETFFLHLGPQRAAWPFGVVFIVNQVVTTLIVLVDVNLQLRRGGASARQITIRTLLAAVVSFSVFFAVARRLLQWEHNGVMAVALGLLGLNVVGFCTAIYAARGNRNADAADGAAT